MAASIRCVGMLQRLVVHLRAHDVPVSPTEHLVLLQALQQHLHGHSLADFRDLARTVLVKDERHLARFELALDSFLAGLRLVPDEVLLELEAAWRAEQDLDPDADGTLASLLGGAGGAGTAEQGEGRGEGAEGEATGQQPGQGKGRGGQGSRQGVSARWNGQDLRALQDDQPLKDRNLQQALRALRRLRRDGRPTELDLEATIRATSRQGGLLDVRMRPPRRNQLKVLLLVDTGGSMDVHARLSTELFQAARRTFQRLEVHYFHNFIYDSVWRQEGRKTVATPVAELIRTYRPDTRLILVGDASMNPFEILDTRTLVNGDVEATLARQPAFRWLGILRQHFRHLAWLNPEPERYWHQTTTIRIIRHYVGGRMYPLTAAGLREAVRQLRKA